MSSLSKHTVSNLAGLIQLVQQGDALRRTKSTTWNEASSRSHSLVVIELEKTVAFRTNARGYRETSRLSLVDLAGSETWVPDETKTKQSVDNFRETSNINKSLCCLTNVILKLAKVSAAKYGEKALEAAPDGAGAQEEPEVFADRHTDIEPDFIFGTLSVSTSRKNNSFQRLFNSCSLPSSSSRCVCTYTRPSWRSFASHRSKYTKTKYRNKDETHSHASKYQHQIHSYSLACTRTYILACMRVYRKNRRARASARLCLRATRPAAGSSRRREP